MEFRLTVSIDNDAFDGENEELARVLDTAKEQLFAGNSSGYLRDYNGNRVGYWEFV